MKMLIIIPAYNEENCIIDVIENLVKNYPQYDYVVINDGSSDHTSQICHQRGYEIIDLPINLGLAGAFQTGLKYAYLKKYDYAMQMDADGQHLPKYIEALRTKINEGYDIVIGSRFVTEKKPKSMRMLGSNLISGAIYMTTGVRIMDPTSGMRIFNKSMIREFANNINYGPEPDTVSFLLKQGAKVGEVQVKMAERMAGESYLNFTKSILYMTKMLISILVLQNFRKRKSNQDFEESIENKEAKK
ncbi:glycosyltransferase family 2 protein [Ruminococcus sp. 5_1_39BFAA]|uniref:glycosyltransferase family 2 protein n=1 Tax=Ruminococcus sp. 5_1_39BFAA TaxID=457412 RepID=UPI003562EA8A